MDEESKNRIVQRLEETLYTNIHKIPSLSLEQLKQTLDYEPDPLNLLDLSVSMNSSNDKKEIVGSISNIHLSFNDFLTNEMKNIQNTIPGTNVTHDFKKSDPTTIEDIFKFDIVDQIELFDWLRTENAQFGSLEKILETAIEKPDPNKNEIIDPKREKAKDKEIQKLVNRVLNISIKNVDLVEDKSNEFAKLININRQPDEEIVNPAKTYEFELDTFQKQAIIHMEKFCNVFVAAHTSAGKTVVAEYAIAMARRSMTKVVYTSPIKALSNQKYRDFSREFGNVGLITGDVQVNTDSSCLILTTEILLQMLDNGSELIRDLEWAIFDEVHYVNDEERGHVWERIFIMLPEHVNLVLLSATVPNVFKFAEWLGRIRGKPTIVITTVKRPVPLEHYLYTGTSTKTINDRFKFIDSNSDFLEHGYKKALETKKHVVKHLKGAKGQNFLSNPQQEKNIYITLIRHLEKAALLPVICFTLSRRRCDSNAAMLQSLDLTTAEEKARIHKFVTRSLDRFKESDRKLRQVVALKEMLKRGFGIHHSGVLPLLKEITEILFCDGLVKVLFATETFAMGVNMPARCVVFDSIKKHDGRNRRFLLPSEYIQMAGRAGRRGKDPVGTVIVLCKREIPESSDLIKTALGQPTPLESKFQLKYSMILTLLRARHHLEVESVIGKSFIEHDRQLSKANFQAKQQTLIKQVNSFRRPECEVCLQGQMSEFCENYLRFMTNHANEQIRTEIFKTAVSKKRILNGRTIVIVGLESNPAALGVVVQVFEEHSPPLVDVLHLKDFSSGKIDYISIGYDQILVILEHAVSFNWTDIHKEKTNLKDGRVVKKVTDKLRNYIQTFRSPLDLLRAPQLHPYSTFEMRSLDFVEAYDKYNLEFQLLQSYHCWSCPLFIQHFQLYFRNQNNIYEIANIAYQLSPESLFLLPEYKIKLEVLRKLKYINNENVPELKAKVACLMSVHELVITEMLTENMLSDCSAAEIAALLSVFVYQQKQFDDELDEAEKPPKTKLESKCQQLKNIARNIGKIQKDCGLGQDVEDFVDTLKFGLVEVVHRWAEGSSFNEILKITDEQEGIIVRCIQRLDEVLRAVKAAFKLIGCPDICEKIEVATQSINRDIVFAASLYVCATQTDDDQPNEINVP